MSESQEVEVMHTDDSSESSAQAKKKLKEIRFEQNKQILQLFYDKYPNCFIPYHIRTKEKKQPKPLALGIHQKIAADNPEIPQWQIKNALSIYVSSWKYRSIIKTGAVRVDLQGNPTDNEVTEEEETHAKTYLAKITERKNATKENQANAAANKKKREEKEMQKTKSTSSHDGKEQAYKSSKSAEKDDASQKNTAVKRVHESYGRTTLSLKKKDKPKEKQSD